MSHTHPTWPRLLHHHPIHSHSFPASVLYAAILNAYESAGVAVTEVAAVSEDGQMRFVVTLGDGEVVMRAPMADAVTGTVAAVRVGDCVQVKAVKEAIGSCKVYKCCDGAEELLFTASADLKLSRRTVVLVGPDLLLFVADQGRVFKFSSSTGRLLFSVDVGETVQCLSRWSDRRLAVLTTDGAMLLLDTATGTVMFKERLKLSSGERVKACCGCLNGVIVVTNQRIMMLQLTDVHDRDCAALPYSHHITILGNHTTIDDHATRTMSGRITIPKEYHDAAPWRQICMNDNGLIAISGRYGFAIYNQRTRKWTIVHPHQPAKGGGGVFVHCHHLLFIDTHFVCATVTVVDSTGGAGGTGGGGGKKDPYTQQTRLFQVRIYTVTAEPINMACRLQLDHQPRLLSVDTITKAMALLDHKRQLSVLTSDATVGWRLTATADLAESSSIIIMMVIMSDGDLVWFMTDGGAVYKVKVSALVDNPVMCTVASVVECEGVCMIISNNSRYLGSIINGLVFLVKRHTVLVYKRDQLLCAIDDVDDGVYDIDESYIYHHHNHHDNVHRRPIFALILVSLLQHDYDISSSSNGSGNGGIIVTLIKAHLEQCLYECFKAFLLDRLIPQISSSAIAKVDLCVAVGRVARTLEYTAAMEFISACRLTVPDMFDIMFSSSHSQCHHHLTTIYKLLIDDDDHGDRDWTAETVKTLVHFDALDEAASVIDLARRLGLPLEGTMRVVQQVYGCAWRRGDYITCKRLSVLGASKETGSTAVDRTKLWACRIIDPTIDDYIRTD